MSIYWWVGGVGANPGLAANWSATEGGAGGAGVPGAGDDIYCSNTSSANGFALPANGACRHFYSTTALTGGTDDWDGGVDLNGNNFTINGNAGIGRQAGTPLWTIPNNSILRIVGNLATTSGAVSFPEGKSRLIAARRWESE